jgi:hypothetical protein
MDRHFLNHWPEFDQKNFEAHKKSPARSGAF